MAAGKEIRGKIRSVENTRKITKAMEMVAASKMRKAQDRMRQSRPYSEAIRAIASNVQKADTDYRHIFLTGLVDAPVENTAGLILVTSDKGLCGGLNSNLFRQVTQFVKKNEQNNVNTVAATIGSKGFSFLNRLGMNIRASVSQIGDAPQLEQLLGTITTMIQDFESGKVKAVYLAYNRFINTMKQEPVIEQLLPIPPQNLSENKADNNYQWDYQYEPASAVIIESALIRYLEALVYQAVVENIACEQSSRMVAMKAASDNAKEVIHSLKLVYNKTRQAAITKELSEIVAGAAAV